VNPIESRIRGKYIETNKKKKGEGEKREDGVTRIILNRGMKKK